MSNLIIRAFLRAAGILLGCLVLLVILAGLGLSGPGPVDMLIHLFAGFGFFLSVNLPKVACDAGTWGPGLAAWLVALAVGHRFLRDWAFTRGFQWRMTTTMSLGLLLPVLFAMAFIVPGILLQVDGLRKERWFDSNFFHRSAMAMLELRNLAQACASFANQDPDGKYPDSLDALVKQEYLSRQLLDLSGDKNVPPEQLIYLGTGYTRDTAGDAPLAISPCFQEQGNWQRRVVVTIDGTMKVIQDDDVDAWLDRIVPR